MTFVVCQSPGNRQRCILTNQGRTKLNAVLKTEYPDGYTIAELVRRVCEGNGINRDSVRRETMSKILNSPKEPVWYIKLEALFDSLDIDLEEEDWTNPEDPPTTTRTPPAPPSSPPDEENFFNALSKLNYKSQALVFSETIEQLTPAAAFLIHGKPDSGQRWLVNRFKSQIPYHTSAWYQSIYIKPHRKDIKTLWQNLAQALGTDPTPPSLIEQTYQHWQTSTVILVLHNVDLIAGSCLQEFMEQFWQPLVNQVQESDPPKRPYRLLLFFIDDRNSKSKLTKSVFFAEKSDLTQPHLPIALPELEPFHPTLLQTWAGIHDEILNQLWQGTEGIETVMEEIVERNNNKPIPILEDICKCFDKNWNDIARTFSI